MRNSITTAVADLVVGIFLVCASSAFAGEHESSGVASEHRSAATQGIGAEHAVDTQPESIPEPSDALLRQVRLQQLNAEVAQELQRIDNEVRIQAARQQLEHTRDGALPELVGTFRVAKGSFAEFDGSGTVFELAEGDYLTPDWRIQEIHVDRISVCRIDRDICRTLTPSRDRAAAKP